MYDAQMPPEARALLTLLIYNDGGSIGGSERAAGWLHDRGYIEAWSAGHWKATEKGVAALPPEQVAVVL